MEKTMDITERRIWFYVFETAGQVPTSHVTFEQLQTKLMCFIGTPHESDLYTQSSGKICEP